MAGSSQIDSNDLQAKLQSLIRAKTQGQQPDDKRTPLQMLLEQSRTGTSTFKTSTMQQQQDGSGSGGSGNSFTGPQLVPSKE